jgi:KaiC/GvpD/RAD55 family RecA-like ATPase
MTDHDKQQLRSDRGALESALRQAGCTSIRGNTAKCPFHDDRNPSASIYQREDGAWAFHCFPCKLNEDVIGLRERIGDPVKLNENNDRAGRRPTTAKTKPRRESPARVFPTIADVARSYAHLGELEDTYEYTNPVTRAVDMVVFRIRIPGDKTFRQASPSPCGRGFVPLAPESGTRPLFNRIAMLDADRIIVTEGEKCVKALRQVGHVATTSPGGANNAKHADWTPLAGKTVYLWPDDDPPHPETGKRTGVEHMREVAQLLEQLDPAPDVFWIDPDVIGLPEKGDAVDFIDLYCREGTPAERKQAIDCILSIAEPIGGLSEFDQMIEDTIAGRNRPIPWKWRAIGGLTQALLPATVTCIAGGTGASKSFFMLEAVADWHARGEKVAVFELEDDRSSHLKRVLAQLEENEGLTQNEWIERHPEETRAAKARHRSLLKTLAPRIHAPDEQVTLDQLIEWMEQRCREGARILVIDPITLAATSDKPWLADLAFLVKAKSIIRRHRASLILVTHPKKDSKGTGLGDIAGGAAYSRFVHTVLFLQAFDPGSEQAVLVKGPIGAFHTTVNRILKIRKARNGRGTGVALGFNFRPESLCFVEEGPIEPAQQQETPYANAFD